MAHTIIGVMGPSRCDAATAEKAERFGRLLAEAGFTLLCGGGTGVMEAASRGAHAAGGLVIGVLPGHDATESAPNPYVDLPIFTGISHARNLINVLSSQVVVAIAGAHGTLSEIAFAIKCGKPVVLLDSWQFSVPESPPAERVFRAKDPQEALALVKQLA
jgi:uncharacterized protein (TIGR00725 family)